MAARILQRVRRGISATSDNGGWMTSCTTLVEGQRNKPGRRKGSVRASDDLLEEIVIEILVRLPVKDLLRYKSVCKAWRATISEPTFIKAHLRCSASRWKQDPSFVMSPHCIIPGKTIPTTLFSNHIRFYQWKQGASAAKLMHDEDFGALFNRVRRFASCDGLVFAPTDTKLYLFNPATRDCITLPESNRNNLWYGGEYLCYCAGLGLDPRSGNYKVVQAFYRSRDPNRYHHMGMEVFTIGGKDGGFWRDMMNDPPYPAESSQTGLSVKGFMFWHMDRDHSTPPRGLLRLDLADETFGVTGLPDSLVDDDDDESFYLDVVYDELCLTTKSGNNGAVAIWTLRMPDQCWEQRFTIRISHICHPLAFLPGGVIIFWRGQFLYRYELSNKSGKSLTLVRQMNNMRYQGRTSRTWENIYCFNINLCVESLMPITVEPDLDFDSDLDVDS